MTDPFHEKDRYSIFSLDLNLRGIFLSNKTPYIFPLLPFASCLLPLASCLLPLASCLFMEYMYLQSRYKRAYAIDLWSRYANA
ncbi:MAG: hypothetical protein F6K26_11940 [Moorea sp. SIO2I5]|nr:hypothetical protein [Moorena sp. SIO2I5]